MLVENIKKLKETKEEWEMNRVLKNKNRDYANSASCNNSSAINTCRSEY